MRPAFINDYSRRVLLAAAVCAAWLGANQVSLAASATNRPAARESTDRYLLIVDTSSAMERNAESTRQIVGQLMSSGMVGHARAGDTIGIWTFSDELRTGDFPLQRWTPQTRQRIAAGAAEFIGQQKYAKRSRFEKVVEALTSVVKDSDRITVLIVTTGSEKISGTPFDQEINESYKLNRAVQRKERMPFLTILRAKGGEYIGWRVNSPPFRPEFPPFPPEPKDPEPLAVEEPKPETKPESKPTAPPPTVPSLIVVGDPPKTTSTPTNAPPAETPVASASQPKPDIQPTALLETPATRTNIGVEPSATVAKPAELPKSDPSPATTPATTASAEVASKPTAPKPDSPAPIEPKPAESNAPSFTTAPETPESTVQTALANPTGSLFNRTNLLIAGAVLLVVAFGLFFVLMRRVARPAEKVSLITRSMDQDEKNL